MSLRRLPATVPMCGQALPAIHAPCRKRLTPLIGSQRAGIRQGSSPSIWRSTTRTRTRWPSISWIGTTTAAPKGWTLSTPTTPCWTPDRSRVSVQVLAWTETRDRSGVQQGVVGVDNVHPFGAAVVVPIHEIDGHLVRVRVVERQIDGELP